MYRVALLAQVVPDYLTITNLGLVGVLGLFVWKLPEVVGRVFAYLEKRQEARDNEVSKLLDAFKTELRYEREQSQRQFEHLMAAVEKRVCGFLDHHGREITVVAPTPVRAT